MSTPEENKWVVLFDGLPEDGSEVSHNAAAYPNSSREAALADFDESVNEAHADYNNGLFLVEVDVTSGEDEDRLVDPTQLEEIVTSGFKGFNTTVVKQYKGSLDDWVDGALSDDVYDETGDSDEHGWAYSFEDSDEDDK